MRAVQIPRPAAAAATLLFLFLFLSVGGCGRGDAGESDTETVAAADSTVVTDSTDLDDKAEGVSKEDGGGKASFFDRILKRGNEEEEEEEEPVPVEIAEVSRRDVAAWIGGTATLEPEKQATVLAKIAGEIRSIEVEEGDFVKAGTVLARLDGRSETVRLEETTARANGLENEFRRLEQLLEQDLVSTQQVNDARMRWEEAEAQRKAAELSLSYTRVTAPFSGVLTQRLIDRGQNVQVGAQLFAIVDSDPLLVRVHVPERSAAGVGVGQPVTLIPDTGDSLKLDGLVALVSPIVDSRTGTVKITCEFDGSGAALRPGSFVRVRLETDRHEDVIVIPKEALVPEGGDTYAYRTAADSVTKVEIETGYADDDFVEVTSGLEPGDRVIVVGQGALRTGSKVRDLAAEAAATETDSEGPDSTESGGMP